MEPYRNVWHIIGRGKAGWHASGIDTNQVSSSGGTPEKYALEAIEDALVYDAENAPEDEFIRLIIAGPMFHAPLNDWEYEYGILNHTRQLLPVPQRACTLESLKALNIRALSYVGAGIYERLLRNIPNVKIGRVHNGEVIWETSNVNA